MENRKPDGDLKYAFEYNQPQPFSIDDIENTLACIAGHNDEDSWYWIVQLKDKRFFLIRASCDYTGWDCQSSCDCVEGTSAEDCASKPLSEYERRKGLNEQLLKQIRGEQPYGLEVSE